MSPESVRPMVYGYVWLPTPDESQEERQRLEAQLRTYAEREGLELGAVFSDGDEQTEGHRPGFLALLEALGTGEATGVLVPALHHLSGHPALQAARVEQIGAQHTRLYIVRPDVEAGGVPEREKRHGR